jgi:predicted DNA-binding protein
MDTGAVEAYIYPITRRYHMTKRVLSATIDESLAERLDRLAAETSRKRSWFVNQALEEYFDALDDYETALRRKGASTTTLANARHELGL